MAIILLNRMEQIYQMIINNEWENDDRIYVFKSKKHTSYAIGDLIYKTPYSGEEIGDFYFETCEYFKMDKPIEYLINVYIETYELDIYRKETPKLGLNILQ